MEHQPEDCRTCCCQSSSSVSVNFFRPYAASQTECSATDNAEYKVSLIPTISDICHPNLPFPGNSDFSELLLVSHPGYQLFSRAITETDDLYPYILYTEQALPFVEVALEEELQQGIIHDYFVPNTAEPGDDSKRRVGEIEVTPSNRYVSMISTLVYNTLVLVMCEIIVHSILARERNERVFLQGMNHWVGFSGLNLCSPKGWKKQMDVCLPLQAAINRTRDPDGLAEAQGNNCAFGHVRFERTDRPAPTCRPHDGQWSAVVIRQFIQADV